MRFLIAVIFAVCLVQGLNGIRNDDITDRLWPLMIDPGTEIATLLRESEIKIRQTYGGIDEHIAVLENDLDQKKSELTDVVKRAQADVVVSGKNINPCVQEVDNRLKTWNQKALAICTDRPELKRLGLTVAGVAKLQKSVKTAIPRCLQEHPGDVQETTTCVDTILIRTEKHIDFSRIMINGTLAVAQENADRCIDRVVSDLKNGLEKLENDFTSCVNNA